VRDAGVAAVGAAAAATSNATDGMRCSSALWLKTLRRSLAS